MVLADASNGHAQFPLLVTVALLPDADEQQCVDRRSAGARAEEYV